MTHYIVKSPWSGRWFDAPYLGMVETKEQAHHYWENDPHLRHIVNLGRESGLKLILCQVDEENNTFTIDNLAAKFEKDMESDPPVPVLEPCEECDDASDWNRTSACSECGGSGYVTVAYA